MKLCEKCIHSEVCKNKENMDSFADIVLEKATLPTNLTFGVTFNCDNYKKVSFFDKFKPTKDKKKYENV